MCRGWTHHHGLSLPRHQHRQLNSREAAHQTPDALNCRVGPQPGLPFKVPDAPNVQTRTPARGAPLCASRAQLQRRTQARRPSMSLNRWRYGDWPSDRQLQEARIKALLRHSSCCGAVQSLSSWCRQGSRKPGSCATVTSTLTGAELPQEKGLVSMHAGSLWSCLTLCDPVDWPATLLSEKGFSRQGYWSVMVSPGCHTLLEHSISCCPSRQPP